MNDQRINPISPRNVSTVSYKVLAPLVGRDGRPIPIPVGGIMRAWPWGEVFAQVEGVGGKLVRNDEIREWLSQGLIEKYGDRGR